MRGVDQVRPEGGFTLAEMLLAIAITTTIILAAAMTLMAGMRAVLPKPGQDPNADPRAVSARRIDQASTLALALPGDIGGVAPDGIATDGRAACRVPEGFVTLLSVTATASSGDWRAADYAIGPADESSAWSELARISCSGAAGVVGPDGERSTMARYLVGSRSVSRDGAGARSEVAGVDHATGSGRVSVWVDADGSGPGERTTVSASTRVDPTPTSTTVVETTVPASTTTIVMVPGSTTTTTGEASTTTIEVDP